MKINSTSTYESLRSQIAVLVVSCDNYADLWQPFFALFRRFWADCPFQIYLLSNHKLCSEPGIITIPVGNDISWSDNLQSGLNKINQKYVFIFIEDLFLVNHVQTYKIQELFKWVVETEANYVRMNPLPRPDKAYNSIVGIVSDGTVYRTATVLSVWKKEVLSDLLKSGENAWEFEIKGTIRSDKYDKFYSTWERLLDVKNGVIKGKWQKNVVRIMGKLGIQIDFSKRRVMTFSESLVFVIVILRNRLFNYLPANARRRIKEIITR